MNLNHPDLLNSNLKKELTYILLNESYYYKDSDKKIILKPLPRNKDTEHSNKFNLGNGYIVKFLL